MGWETVVCWSTKAAISLKRVKIEEKLLWRACRKSPTLFPTVPSPAPYCLLFPKTAGSRPHPRILSLLFQERAKLRASKFVRTFIGSVGTLIKPVKMSGKVAVGLPKIFRAPIRYRAHHAVIFATAQLSCFISTVLFKRIVN